MDFPPAAHIQRKPFEVQRNLLAIRLIHDGSLPPHNPRHHFRLIVRRRKVKGKCHPQRKPFSVMLPARNQQTAPRNISCFAHFGLLPQRRNPPKPHGKAQTYPGMLTLLHSGNKMQG
jgi:hypothetical protein